jgi:conjugal transfer pilus assembly protein TrbC
MKKPMTSVHHLMRLAIALLLTSCAAAFAAPQKAPVLESMPSDEAINKVSSKAMKKSTTLIERALTQSQNFYKPVPDVGEMPVQAMPDPALLAKQFEDMQVKVKPESALLVMVSFSMPEASMARIAAQASKAGATLVLRGVVDSSLKKTAELAAEFVKRYPGLNFEIDPTVFKRYSVKQVPTFILARENKSIKGCTKGCDASDYFVSVSGDVTLDYALDYFSRFGGERFSAIADKNLKKLRAN